MNEYAVTVLRSWRDDVTYTVTAPDAESAFADMVAVYFPPKCQRKPSKKWQYSPDPADRDNAYAAIPKGTPMSHPDVLVLIDVINCIHMAEPCRRSRRRLSKAISNIYRMADEAAK